MNGTRAASRGPLPLRRDNMADIRALVRYLIQKDRGGSEARDMELDPEAKAYLLAHAWPGNVRELDNVINRARIVAENNGISVADLPAARVRSVDPRAAALPEFAAEGSLREQLSKLEIEIILRAIGNAQGDRRLASQRLGISLSSLYRKLGDRA